MKCGPWRNDLEVWVNMCAGKLQMLIGSNLSNPRKLNGQCNGVVMMQGNDGKQQRRRRKGKVAPIPSTLLFAPLTESLLSPSFCNLSQHLANGTSQMYNSFVWQKMLGFCFLFNLLVWQQQWLQLVDNSSFGEASCLLWVGGALHWGWAGNIASC